jgi:hypothetical protein
MDLLTVITIVSALISFISGSFSQIYKTSIDIEGQNIKQLTPVGWLLLGIALAGLITSVSSVLINVSLKNNERRQAQTEAAHKQALQQQEERWRSDMSSLLQIAKDDIEKNLGNTIAGFADSQQRFNRTQAEIVSSRQSVLESNLHHTNEIIVSGQPLTSLAFQLRFDSANPQLRQRIITGADEIEENSMTAQGHSTAVPLEAMEYEEAVMPLLSYLARIADGEEPKDQNDSAQTDDDVVVLISLDESQNAILSFGEIGGGVSWFKNQGKPSLSAGFLDGRGLPVGNSTPSVTTHLAKSGRRSFSTYRVHWELDPTTLAKSIDRTNAQIPPTAKLPRILKIAILHNVKMLPFPQNDFAVSYATNLWRDVGVNRHNTSFRRELKNAIVSLEVNGVREINYLLRRMYRLELMNEYDHEFETSCTLLEFEAMQKGL